VAWRRRRRDSRSVAAGLRTQVANGVAPDDQGNCVQLTIGYGRAICGGSALLAESGLK
jgi:hypothetical protein